MEIVDSQNPCAALEREFRNQLHAIVFLIGEGRDAEAIRIAEQGPWRPSERGARQAPVTAGAHRCGWASASAFIDVIRRTIGYTPGMCARAEHAVPLP
ncbi:hypothetical protein [Micromonospora deserti]|uniref:HTH araC/xylS-type domain-containing protein n=1 Tax=Micromonospora deserti TaxID=2070366 RepID=A0A2W2CS24_9ACTN|nr:hypothetical protein [Micromonospora deserti]PZG02336.1 hypothetical protein C1I99_03080 [Micromonospora deserti]